VTKQTLDKKLQNSSPEPRGLPNTDPRWWQSVRTRFGLLLALALLPWLLLTTLEALSTLGENRVSQSQLADIVASNTVREVGRILEAGRLGLDAAPLMISERGCEEGASEVLRRLDGYTALVIEGTDGISMCQSPASISSLVLNNATDFSVDSQFRIERGVITEGDTAEDVIVLQNIIRSSGQTFTLVMPEGLGLSEMTSLTLGSESILALRKQDGEAIFGLDIEAERALEMLESVSSEEITLFTRTTLEGDKRRVASRYFEDLGLYVSVGRSLRQESISGFINPVTAVFLPILAWLIGFMLIWLGTQTMLLTPISKVRLAARKFAGGKLGSRVKLSGSAATEVHGLANSFNRMAEQLQEREIKIADNLDEKDTLMREIHHRVKNNLQIIISLLNMQERKADTKEALEAIAETRTRINAIAIVHRGLYESADLRQIDIGPFISRLLSAMNDSLGTEDAGISLSHSVEPCQLPADSAIPIALFIVEAISNAAEHGITHGGKIHVAITRPTAGQVQIDVGDDGCGVSDPDAMRGVGSKLMKGFARQLSGTLIYKDNSPGLLARLTLPIDDSLDQPFQVSRKRD